MKIAFNWTADCGGLYKQRGVGSLWIY